MASVLKQSVGRKFVQNNMMPHLLGGLPSIETIYFPDNLIFRSSYLTDEAALMRMLPPGLRPAGEPIVTYMYRHAENLAWIVGGEANIFGIYVTCTFKGKKDEVTGAYWPVLWEDDTMATVLGREVLGVAKLHAEITNPLCIDGVWHVDASEGGRPFASMRLGNFKPMATDKLEAIQKQALGAGVIGWKHIPSPDFKKADVSYGIYMRSPNQIKEAWAGEAELTLHETDPQFQMWSHPVIETLRTLPLKKNLGAVMLRGTGEHRVSQAVAIT
jgi:acetoacetate decarboxylase